MKSRVKMPLTVVVPLVTGFVICCLVLASAILIRARLAGVVADASTSLRVQTALSQIKASMADVDTGERGYLLTGRKEYLQPYLDARNRLDAEYVTLRDLVRASGQEELLNQASRLNQHIGMKLAEVELALTIYQQQGTEATMNLLGTDFGKQKMDTIRSDVVEMESTLNVANQRAAQIWQRNVDQFSYGIYVLAGCTIALLIVVWLLARRDVSRREHERTTLDKAYQDMELEVRARTLELTKLTRYLQDVREDEKRKLARDLHDELGNIVVSAKMDLQAVVEELNDVSPAASARLQRAQLALNDAMAIKRHIIEDLRPTMLDNLGLGPALEWQVSQVCERARLAYHTTILDDLPAPEGIAIALFRIVQEALTNVVRHASATKVHVRAVASASRIEVSIEDDGIGVALDTLSDHISHGIAGMRYRAETLGGEFSIQRRPEGGTRVVASIPVPESAPLDASETPAIKS